MGLREYQRKRDFSRTAEPKPKLKKSKHGSTFVIQKHDASRLHYDFRLEMDGTLKSWAVPKGIPFAKGEKHLAVHVEDHPLDYAAFEGTIPKGQYGGGTVMVWDFGTYEVYGENPMRELEQGRLHFALRGKKLDGEWALIQIRRGESGNEWLLLKSGESMTPLSKKKDDESAKTGRTMPQIAKENDAEWQSNRTEKLSGKQELKQRIAEKIARRDAGAKKESGKQESRKAENKDNALGLGGKEPPAESGEFGRAKKGASVPEQSALSSLPAFLLSRFKSLPPAKPGFVEPMKAKFVDAPPRGGDWSYELKLDGFRALAVKSGDEVQLISRNEKPLTQKFQEVARELMKLAWRSGVMDGEIVALDEEGRSSFQLLQAYEMHEERPPICYYAFDILNLNGRDLRALPLSDRKQILEQLIAGEGKTIRFSANIEGDADELLTVVKNRGLEGIVGKRRDADYEAGRRSGAWIKLKVTNEQEFVIGGYTEPQGARKHFGALLVGYYEKKKLQFAAKVGTGYTEKSLRELYKRFQPLRRETCPFVNLPTKRQGRWGQGITRAEMSRCMWLDPKLVAQVRFSEWTRDAGLRHPAFLGLRQDKEASEVVRERA